MRQNGLRLFMLPAAAALAGCQSAAAPRPAPGPGEIRFAERLGIKLVTIPAGRFLMGSPDYDRGVSDWEQPQHPVRISRPFLMAAHTVTVGQFRAFVEDTGYKTEAETDKRGGAGWNAARGNFEHDEEGVPEARPKYTWRYTGFPQGPNHPVVNVTRQDVLAFCAWLTKKDGRSFRLPTEAEWEYACRAGTQSKYFTGDEPDSLRGYANVPDESAKRSWAAGHVGYFAFTAPVGSFKPNPWGLYDMVGNVWHWTADWFDWKHYPKEEAVDPVGPPAPPPSNDDVFPLFQVRCTIRGGSFEGGPPRHCRSANRGDCSPHDRTFDLGFRVVADLP